MTQSNLPSCVIPQLEKTSSISSIGFIPLVGIGLPIRALWKRNLCKLKPCYSHACMDQSFQDNDWVRCKVFRCGERHIFLGPTKSLTNSKALPIDIDCKLDVDLIRSALGFYRMERVSIFLSLGTLFYFLRLKRMQHNRLSLPHTIHWKSILAILYKTLLLQWSGSIQIIQHLIQDMRLTPIKVLIKDEVSSIRGHEKSPSMDAQIFFTFSQRQYSLYAPRSFAIALATAYRIPIYVSRMLVERNSVYPQVDCRGKWYIANPTTAHGIAHLSRNAPIWKYRISELERMETQQLYNIMLRSGIPCSRTNTHQELIIRLIPFMDRIQRRSVFIWRELWKRKMYKSLKKKLA
ncbi:hypothetical protein GpartN1_g6257.t1 [Galdieria partita]|uniref:Uncharacterized protein n=1 Tax=Galdieria partita TaxID=83374 RepID=A0A9C7Q1G7_9RHOD|nr:hypothetical protein GpartN1_g6257.t1 [Galdieria partita]